MQVIPRAGYRPTSSHRRSRRRLFCLVPGGRRVELSATKKCHDFRGDSRPCPSGTQIERPHLPSETQTPGRSRLNQVNNFALKKKKQQQKKKTTFSDFSVSFSVEEDHRHRHVFLVLSPCSMTLSEGSTPPPPPPPQAALFCLSFICSHPACRHHVIPPDCSSHHQTVALGYQSIGGGGSVSGFRPGEKCPDEPLSNVK